MGARRWVDRWWSGGAGLPGAVLDAALLPAEAAFRAAAHLRNATFDRELRKVDRVPVPVLSVGNLSVGGTGKTPVAAWLARTIGSWGRTPALVLRGYGGDEVLLHREINPHIPVFAAPRRAEAARAAVAAGCDAVVLDDGFQHRALARDLDIVLISSETWSEHRRLLPRGPWREGLSALSRAGVVAVTRKSTDLSAAAVLRAQLERGTSAPVVECALLPKRLRPLSGSGPDQAVEWLEGQDVLAVAALAAPGAFFASVAAAARTVEPLSYPDHHPFTAADALGLMARAAGRTLLMTHKDAVKLRPLLPQDAPAYILEQEVTVTHGADLLDAALRTVLAG